MGNCNGGNNAKWCPATPSPAPSPSPEDKICAQRDGSFSGEACGYNCDDNCNCGHCNTAPGCLTEDTCLGTCNAGGNAKWCGKAPPPPPPTPPVPPPSPAASWTTSANRLQRNGNDVVLHGLGTTCTEYLARGIGMHCWVKYNWQDATDILKVDTSQLFPLIDTLMPVASESVVPVVRIPLTASSWLGVNTSASAANMAKYPDLNLQYQKFIGNLVKEYTERNIVTILDLHWTDDDTDNAPMAGKGATNCVDFWDSVASIHGSNPYVFYELYNEPHRVTQDQWMNGDSTTSGMLEMLGAVRKHTSNPVIIAGYGGYAYDADSLVALDGQLNGDKNIIYNFHPYMGPNQAGDSKKCPVNFESYLTKVLDNTDKPAIITEFGQSCNAVEGPAEQCDGTYDGVAMGYDHTIVTIADKHAVSWLPWAWKPQASGPNTKNCQDINGGDATGTTLITPADGLGGDFAGLWKEFGPKAPPSRFAHV